jgi:hydrogenase nickel incorporation protein HypA/HybF
LIKTVQEEALSRGVKRVLSVDLVVGETTGYMKDSLDFYFELMARPTLAKGAVLRARYVKPTLRCEACGKEFERQRFSFDCPACGGLARPTQKGTEFYIESMEVENGD